MQRDFWPFDNQNKSYEHCIGFNPFPAYTKSTEDAFENKAKLEQSSVYEINFKE